MQLRSIKKDQQSIMGIIADAKEYAARHGWTYDSQECVVKDSDGGTHVVFSGQGSGRVSVVCEADFNSEWMDDPTGRMSLSILDKERALKIMRMRSGCEEKPTLSGYFILHDGEIMLFVYDSDCEIYWWGDAEVTKHVASLLGLLKEVTGPREKSQKA